VRETDLPSTASASAQAAPKLHITPGVASGALDSRHIYAALDLGTNNCRLLIARPEHRPRRRNNDFLRIIDAFSRIVRLGEGLGKAIPLTYWFEIIRRILMPPSMLQEISQGPSPTTLEAFGTFDVILLLLVSATLFFVMSVGLFRLMEFLARRSGKLDQTTAY